jgi:hypothetical protein
MVAQVIKFCMVAPNMFSKITAAFLLTYSEVYIRHALSRKCQRTARHTGHDTTASPWYGTCFMSPLGTWNIEVPPGFLEKLSTPTPDVL